MIIESLQKIEYPILMMLSGPPGVGKSYLHTIKLYWDQFWAENIILPLGYHVFSTDKIIENICDTCGMTYNDGFKDLYDFAEKMSYKGLEYALIQQRSVVWDQTNITPKSRKRKLTRFLTLPNSKIYTRIGVGYEFKKNDILTILLRAEIREKVIGKHIDKGLIEDMFNQYEPPTLSEGFEHIIMLDIDHNFLYHKQE